jgi:hypothetical protein
MLYPTTELPFLIRGAGVLSYWGCLSTICGEKEREKPQDTSGTPKDYGKMYNRTLVSQT